MSVRMLSVLSALVLMVSLAACGSGKAPSESSVPSAASSPESPQSESAEEPDPVLAAVEEMIAQYNDGTVDSTNFPELPEGFVFPAALTEDNTQVTAGETEETRVSVPSVSMESPRENVTINSEERAEFTLDDNNQIVSVVFYLDRSEQIIPLVIDYDEGVAGAVEEQIAQYNSGTVAVTENIPALPEGFVFPEKLDWQTLEITLDEGMGSLNVTVPSADGEQSATFACYNFTLPEGDASAGQVECHVSYVFFH